MLNIRLKWFILDGFNYWTNAFLKLNKGNIVTLTPTWEDRRCRQATMNHWGERKSVTGYPETFYKLLSFHIHFFHTCFCLTCFYSELVCRVLLFSTYFSCSSSLTMRCCLCLVSGRISFKVCLRYAASCHPFIIFPSPIKIKLKMFSFT